MPLTRFRPLNFVLAALCLYASMTATARADIVYLANGSVFEDVIVTAHTATHVRVRLPFGELSLRASQVERIVEETSAFERFLEKRTAFEATSANPEEWLALAEWAELHGLHYGYREIVLMLAKRAPLLPGLAPHMRALGYELDKSVGAWAQPRGTTSSAVRRLPEPAKPEVVEVPRDEEPTTSASLARAVELMAEADLVRARKEPSAPKQPRQRYLLHAVPAWPAVIWSGWTFPQHPSSEPPPPADPNPEYPVVRRPSDPMARALLRRQPGSIIPLSSLAR